MKDRHAASQYFLITFLLTLSSGYIDAYTYTIRGGVFANVQTGNIVLIGVNIANQTLSEVLKFIFPVIAFTVGILLYDIIASGLNNIIRRTINRRAMILLVDAAILAAAGFIPSGDKCNYAVNIMISFAATLQYAALKKSHGAPSAATAREGTLASACTMLRKFIRCRDRQARNAACWRFGLIIVFCVGCGIGCSMGKAFGTRSIWVCALFTAAVAAMLAAEDTGK